jgi:hypothetical protein
MGSISYWFYSFYELSLFAGVTAVLAPAILSIIAFFWIKSKINQPPNQFIVAVLGSTMLRMITHLVVILIIQVFFEPALIPFLLLFFISFLLFIAWELFRILKLLRK